MSLVLATFVSLCVGTTQDAKLEIVNHRRTYGHLGAPRPKDGGSLPGEIAHFTFEIKNLKLDENRKASYSVAIEIRDAEGKIIYEQRPYNSVAQNFLGGDTLPCSAHIEIPLDLKPGVVDWKITVVDRHSKQTAIASGKGKILPADFGIVQVGLYSDAEGHVSTPAVVVVGEAAYLRLAAVGFGRGKDGQPDVEVSMKILDDKGQATMPRPIVGKINAGVDAKDKLLPVQFGLIMNRAGRYTIEATATCRHCGKTSQINYGIRVMPLE